MTRIATRYDKEQIIEMMLSFKDESPMRDLIDEENTTYWHQLLDNILAGQGICFIEDNIGLLLGIILPSIWNPKILTMHELAWWVKPEHRGGLVGMRLLRQYIDYANELKKQNRIKYFTLSKLSTSPDFKYEKLGFKKTDENWIQ
jgi:RimJ/RimL family protein N-acetyltransferase